MEEDGRQFGITNGKLQFELDVCGEAYVILRALARLGPQSVSRTPCESCSKVLNPGLGLMTSAVQDDLYNWTFNLHFIDNCDK